MMIFFVEVRMFPTSVTTCAISKILSLQVILVVERRVDFVPWIEERQISCL